MRGVADCVFQLLQGCEAARLVRYLHLAEPVNEVAQCVLLGLVGRRQTQFQSEVVGDARWGHRVVLAATRLTRNRHEVCNALAVAEHNVEAEQRLIAQYHANRVAYLLPVRAEPQA